MENPKVKAALKGIKVTMAVISIVLAAVDIKNTLELGSTEDPKTDPAPEA